MKASSRLPAFEVPETWFSSLPQHSFPCLRIGGRALFPRGHHRVTAGIDVLVPVTREVHEASKAGQPDKDVTDRIVPQQTLDAPSRSRDRIRDRGLEP